MQQLYGDTSARTARLAESAAQLQAEAAAHTSQARRQPSSSNRPSMSASPSPNHGSPAPTLHSLAQSATTKSQAQNTTAAVASSTNRGPRANGPPQPGGPHVASSGSAASTSRRIVPQAVGAPHAAGLQQAMPSLPPSGSAFMTGSSRPVPAGLQGRMGPPPPVPPSSSRPGGVSIDDGVGSKRPAQGPADAGRAAKR